MVAESFQISKRPGHFGGTSILAGLSYGSCFKGVMAHVHRLG